MKRSRLIVPIAALLLIAIVGWWFWGRRGEDAAVPSPPSVPVAVVRFGQVEETLHVTGRVGPVAGTQNKLAFSISGTVQSVDVHLGQRVRAGQMLARLDSAPYAYAAQAAHADAAAAAGGAALASVDRTSVKLRVDAADLQRQRRLYAAGIVAQRDVAAAEAVVASDRAESQSTQIQRSSAQAQSASAAARAGSSDYDLARTQLRAISDGVVTNIYLQSGETVDASTPVVAVVADATHLATLDVAVSDVPRIGVGDLVRASSGNTSWRGRIAGMAPAIDQSTGLAVATVAGVPHSVVQGTPVSGDVVVGHANGLAIPLTAIVEDPQTGKKLVFVRTRAGGQTSFVPRDVSIGAQGGGMVLVLSGLKAGETVATQGAIELLEPPQN